MLPRRPLALWLSCGIFVTAIALGSCTPSPPTPEPSPSPTPDTTATPLPSDDGDPGVGTEPPTTPAAPQSPPPQTDRPISTPAAEVYWLDMGSDRLALVSQPLNPTTTSNPEAALTTALETLLDGPQNAAHSTTIPPEARLRGITVKADGVHVDLSADFTTGGGTTSMTGRVAQILYTATSLDPNTPVWLAVESEPLEILGGEGLMIRQPLTRQEFHEDFEL